MKRSFVKARVYPNGRRSFVCSYRVHGRKRIATLGRGDVLKLDTARKKALSYLGQVADGIDPKAAAEALKAAGTVSLLVDTYIERHAKLKKNTWQDDHSYLARHLLPRFGYHLAATISTDGIADLHADIGRSHPYSANRLLEIVRKMYTWPASGAWSRSTRPIPPPVSNGSARPNGAGF